MGKSRNHWTKERIFTEAKKYQSKSEFKKVCTSAYQTARVNGWLDEMDWFVRPIVHNKKWYRENVFDEARKYQTRTEFCNNSNGAYRVGLKNGWLDEMIWFIDGKLKALTDKNDSVYKYYFKESNSFYIGRTLMYRQKIRHNEHISDDKDTVYKYAKENGFEIPQMKIIEENLTIEEGLEREDYWKNYYKERGYNILNVAKTGKGSGSIGAIAYGKWSKENVFNEAKKYNTRSEFQKSCVSAYQVALRNGWLSEMSWFMEGKRPNGYWNIKENILAEAKKYQTRSEFCKGCGSAYQTARVNGWLSEMSWFKHIKCTQKTKNSAA